MAWTLVFALWVLGFCLSLKVEAVQCNHATDYGYLLNPAAWVLWPIIAVLHLKTRHPARAITYAKGLHQIEFEEWVL